MPGARPCPGQAEPPPLRQALGREPRHEGLASDPSWSRVRPPACLPPPRSWGAFAAGSRRAWPALRGKLDRDGAVAP